MPASFPRRTRLFYSSSSSTSSSRSTNDGDLVVGMMMMKKMMMCLLLIVVAVIMILNDHDDVSATTSFLSAAHGFGAISGGSSNSNIISNTRITTKTTIRRRCRSSTSTTACSPLVIGAEGRGFRGRRHDPATTTMMIVPAMKNMLRINKGSCGSNNYNKRTMNMMQQQQQSSTLSTSTTSKILSLIGGATTPPPPVTSSSMLSSLALLLFGTTSISIDRTVAIASASATAKLLCSIALGGYAASKRTGYILDPKAISVLSKLVYWIFQPAFLLCSVGKTLAKASTPGSGGLSGEFLALMPLTSLLQIAQGTIIGYLLTRGMADKDDDSQALALNQREVRNIRACTAFANSGPLPLIFANALFAGSGPIQAEVTACISFYLLVWSPLFWSYGQVLLGTYDDVIGGGGDSTATSTRLQRYRQQIKRFLSPPVTGSLLGIAVGSIGILRRSCIPSTAKAVGISGGFVGLLSPLFGALETLGSAYLPAAILVLAGSLMPKPPKTETDDQGTKTTAATSSAAAVDDTRPSIRSIISICIARFILAPLLSLGIVSVLSRLGWLGIAGTRSRSVVTFCILMQGCMPPAQNTVIMLQLANQTTNASVVAKLLTILYTLAVIPVTFLLSASLAISGIMDYV